MADDHRAKVKALLEEHKRTVATLHEHLKAVGGADAHKLDAVLKKHTADHEKFEGDCEECWLST